MVKVSLQKDKIKFLLLEGVHQSAVENLKAAGYTNIEYHKSALSDEELKKRLKMHVLLVSVPVLTLLKRFLRQQRN